MLDVDADEPALAAAAAARASRSARARRPDAIMPRTSDPCSASSSANRGNAAGSDRRSRVAREDAEHHRRHQPIRRLTTETTAREVPHALVVSAAARRHPGLAQETQHAERSEDPRRHESHRDWPRGGACARRAPGIDAPPPRRSGAARSRDQRCAPAVRSRGRAARKPARSRYDRPAVVAGRPRLAADRGLTLGAPRSPARRRPRSQLRAPAASPLMPSRR